MTSLYVNPHLNSRFPVGVVQKGNVVCYGGNPEDLWVVDQVIPVAPSVNSGASAWIRAVRVAGRSTDPSKSIQQTFPDGVFSVHPHIVASLHKTSIVITDSRETIKRERQAVKRERQPVVVHKVVNGQKEVVKLGAADAAPKKKYPNSIDDPVARLLGECTSLEELWRLFEGVVSIVGADCPYSVEDTRTKVSHLQSGLQRMGLGNRVRTLYKKKLFNPQDWTWDGDHLEQVS